jgi:hypothetical protein
MIGIQTNAVQLNGVAGDIALKMRNICQAAMALNEYITTVGGATGLQDPTIGFDSADATAFATAVNYLATISALYFGTASQPTNFDFDNAVSALYGGN